MDSNAEHCVRCGADIPEGRQVCPMCDVTMRQADQISTDLQRRIRPVERTGAMVCIEQAVVFILVIAMGVAVVGIYAVIVKLLLELWK